MQNDQTLILSQDDFQKISALLLAADSETAELLSDELLRADVVTPEELPADVVAMNSEVKFLDLDTEKESVVRLVYPHEVNVDEHKISILSPMGSALIGLREGQSIRWPLPTGKTRVIRVLKVS